MSLIHPEAKIHAKALVDDGAAIGARTRVWAFAHVLGGARVGADCNLCDGVFIENEVSIGNSCTIKNGVAVYNGVALEDDVFVGPNAVFTNDLIPRAGRFKGSAADFLPTRVRMGASIGANATIVCGHEVGSYALVGAGAVVTRDVPPYAVVVGNPARVVGHVCACAKRLDDSLRCTCGRRYERLGEGLKRIEA
jgi:UDP-2-acetamido-3-amino-2,3-dideoxy-glucuronate N-acetyltransferase